VATDGGATGPGGTDFQVRRASLHDRRLVALAPAAKAQLEDGEVLLRVDAFFV
jgi:hypothetical protein